MTTFSDARGEIWSLELNLGNVRRIREALGLDLLNPTDYLRIMNSLTDRLTFVFLLCEEKATAIGLSADDFEKRLYGKGISTKASEALLRATELFFQDLDQTGMATLAQKSIGGMKAGRIKLDELVGNGELDSLLDKLMTPETTTDQVEPPTTGKPSPSGPSSSESSHGNSASES